MSEIYQNLGANVVLNSFVKASDFNDIQSAIIRELQRRNITVVSNDSASTSSTVKGSMRESIHNNCVAGGYTGTESSSTITAEQLQRYITFIKGLYSKIVIT